MILALEERRLFKCGTVGQERPHPPGKVGDVGVDAAIAQDRAGVALVLLDPFPILPARAIRTVRDGVLAFHMRHAPGHTEGGEDPLLQEGGEALPARLLDRERELAAVDPRVLGRPREAVRL